MQGIGGNLSYSQKSVFYFCLKDKGVGKWLTLGQEAETIWIESELQPWFLWFHILWSLIKYKFSHTFSWFRDL